jgi:hypothetical protein
VVSGRRKKLITSAKQNIYITMGCTDRSRHRNEYHDVCQLAITADDLENNLYVYGFLMLLIIFCKKHDDFKHKFIDLSIYSFLV